MLAMEYQVTIRECRIGRVSLTVEMSFYFYFVRAKIDEIWYEASILNVISLGLSNMARLLLGFELWQFFCFLAVLIRTYVLVKIFCYVLICIYVLVRTNVLFCICP